MKVILFSLCNKTPAKYSVSCLCYCPPAGKCCEKQMQLMLGQNISVRSLSQEFLKELNWPYTRKHLTSSMRSRIH